MSSSFINYEADTFRCVGALGQALSELGFRKLEFCTRGRLLDRAGRRTAATADIVIRSDFPGPNTADLGFKLETRGFFPVVEERDAVELFGGRFLDELRAAYARHPGMPEATPLTRDEEAKVAIGRVFDDLLTLAASHGWAVMKVHNDPASGTPTLAYSVGLHENFGHPEIVLTGFDPGLMQNLINDMGEVVRAGGRYEPGRDYDRIVRGYACRTIEVSAQWRLLFMYAASWFYNTVDFPTLQLLLPDPQGLFPTDEACEEEYRRVQPLLDAEPPERAGRRRARRAPKPSRE